ncbi:MAG: cobalamin-dependent protein, partial [Anaerolineales bacterium]|nr:cobalamin-dependent protein [Anaerolineales bacterium]
ATPTEFFENCIAPTLQEVGKKFETLDIFLPEMVTAAETVEVVNTEVINPAVADSLSEVYRPLGKVLLATVQADLHDIGKNMVGLMLKVNGFEVIDLGTNVSPSEIVARAEFENVDIIGMSALLTTCLPYMKDVCNYLEGKGIRDKYAVIIGGAATTPKVMEDMGANAYGSSAADGVSKCKLLLNKL